MRFRRIAISAAFATGLAVLPVSTAKAQYYAPCSPFPLAWPFCVAGAIVGAAATIATAPFWVLSGMPPYGYYMPPYYPPQNYYAPGYYVPPYYLFAASGCGASDDSSLGELRSASGAGRLLLLPGQQGLLSVCCQLRRCLAARPNHSARFVAAIKLPVGARIAYPSSGRTLGSAATAGHSPNRCGEAGAIIPPAA